MVISGWGNNLKLESSQQYVSSISQVSDIISKENFDGIVRASGRSYGDSSLALNTINLSKMKRIVLFDEKL